MSKNVKSTVPAPSTSTEPQKVTPSKPAAEASQADSAIAPHIPTDSIKMLGEAIGLSNVSDDALRVLADDVTMRVSILLQDARKYAQHSKRSHLVCSDLAYAMKNKNIPPMFGYENAEPLPFRFVSTAGRELYFQEEKEDNLSEIITQASQAKLPQDIALKSHWLSIDGIQPATPDNPPPLNRDHQRLDAIDPLAAIQAPETNENKFLSRNSRKYFEGIQVRQQTATELSVEQQLYYKEITEACVGSDENRRTEALASLSGDSGLHLMLPRICNFISEGVKLNVVQNNLALLIYLMRMVKSILDNKNLYLEKYLHQLIPAVVTCVVSKKLCLRPEHDNHWALRDFGARLIAQICKKFNTNSNGIQVRITHNFINYFDDSLNQLINASMYGIISCFCELGPEVQQAFLFRRLKALGEKVNMTLEGYSGERSSAEHITKVIMKFLPITIKNSKIPFELDTIEDYRNQFGDYFGNLLFNAVQRLGATAGPTPQTPNTPNTGPSSAGGPGNPQQFRRVPTGQSFQGQSLSQTYLLLK